MSEVKATIFQRKEDEVARPFIDFQLVDEFTPYSGFNKGIYSTASKIDWSVTDTSVHECMIDHIESTGLELVFNRNILSLLPQKPLYSTSSLTDGLPALPLLFPSPNPHKFYTEFYSVIASSFDLYSFDGTAGIVTWTAVNNFTSYGTGDRVYKLNPNIGEVIINTGMIGATGEFRASYNAVPLVEYRIGSTEGNYYQAQETTLARIVTNLDRGSVIYTLRDTEILDNLLIKVSIPSLDTIDSLTWNNCFYGDSPHQIVFTVVNTITGERVPSIPLLISIESGIGSLLGITEDLSLYTDENGEAFAYFLPPALGDSIGALTTRVSSTTLQLVSGSDAHYFENLPQEIYLYGIYKDDPLQGRIDDPGNFEGTIVWYPDVRNGRRRLMYVYDPSARHPIYNTPGAFAPLRPTLVTSTSFVYPSTIPLDENTNDANNLGGYFVAGPRATKISAKVDVSSIENTFISTVKRDIKIITGLSSYAKGEYAVGNLRYPFGWRLPGSVINPSSQLGGALFLTINPVAGIADILFESTESEPFTSELVLEVTVTNV